jgi:hypothetical protein
MRCAPHLVALAKPPLKDARRCGQDFPTMQLGDRDHLRPVRGGPGFLISSFSILALSCQPVFGCSGRLSAAFFFFRATSMFQAVEDGEEMS